MFARLPTATAPDFTKDDDVWTSTSTLTTLLVPDLTGAFAMVFRTGHYYQAKFAASNDDFDLF